MTTYTIPDFGPSDLLTSDKEEFRRVKVDIAQTSFFAGREFRSFYELNIAAGATLVIRFSAPIDFILASQSLVIDSGTVRLVVAVAGTPSGTFGVALPVIPRNAMVGALSRQLPYYSSQVTVAAGGVHTGGVVREVIRLKSAGATAQRNTVGAAVGTERGLPAGDYYIRIENIGTGAVTGVYTIEWEERP